MAVAKATTVVKVAERVTVVTTTASTAAAARPVAKRHWFKY